MKEANAREPDEKGPSPETVMANFAPEIVTALRMIKQTELRFRKKVDEYQSAIGSVVDTCRHPSYYESQYLSSAENNHDGYLPPLFLCSRCGLVTEKGCVPFAGVKIGFMDRHEMMKVATEQKFHPRSERDERGL